MNENIFERPMRWAQLTLVENDPGRYDPDFWLDYFRRVHADGAVLNYLVSPRYNEAALEQLEAGAKVAGRSLDCSSRLPCCSCAFDNSCMLDIGICFRCASFRRCSASRSECAAADLGMITSPQTSDSLASHDTVSLRPLSHFRTS